jgi:hypothetical protein
MRVRYIERVHNKAGRAMLTIELTRGIKTKKYSLWADGIELARSLSKKTATKLQEYYNDLRRLQRSCSNDDETVCNVSRGVSEAEYHTKSKGERTFSMVDKVYGCETLSSSVCDERDVNGYNAPSTGDGSGTHQKNGELHKESLVAEFVEANRALRRNSEEQNKCIRDQCSIVREQRSIVREQHSNVLEIASVARVAIQTANLLGAEIEGRRTDERRNTQPRGLEQQTIDVQVSE